MCERIYSDVIVFKTCSSDTVALWVKILLLFIQNEKWKVEFHFQRWILLSMVEFYGYIPLSTLNITIESDIQPSVFSTWYYSDLIYIWWLYII